MATAPTFTLGDIPITVEPSFFLVIGLFGLAAPGLDALLLWVGIATVSVLVHELGHAAAFRAYGSPATIRLYGMGGVTTGARLPARQNLVVSLAGPLSGLLLLGVPAVVLAWSTVGEQGSFWEVALTYAIFINVLWSLINLLPVLPLDGGNVLMSLLHLATGRDAERTTHVVSIAVSALGGAWGLAAGLPVVAVLAAFGAAMNIAALSQHGEAVRSAAVLQAQEALLAGNSWDAVQRAEVARSTSKSIVEQAAAVDVQTWAWLLAGDRANAHVALARRPADVPMSAALQGGMALASGHQQQGLGLIAYALVDHGAELDRVLAVRTIRRAGLTQPLCDELLRLHDPRATSAAAQVAGFLHLEGAFAEAAAISSRLAGDPRFDTGLWSYNTACSMARAGRLDAAVDWLRTAIDAGWSDLARLDRDPDLALLHALPGYWTARTRLRPVP